MHTTGGPTLVVSARVFRFFTHRDETVLAIFEFFYAVRDHDVITVKRLLDDSLVDVTTPLLPSAFPSQGGMPAPPLPHQEDAGTSVGDGGEGGKDGEGEGGAEGEQRGGDRLWRRWRRRHESWPRAGFEGCAGDTALHLASR